MSEDRNYRQDALELSGAVWRKSRRSGGNGSCVEAAMVWRKSSQSGPNGACVEVAARRRAIAVRDSKDPAGPMLGVTPAVWTKFLHGIQSGAVAAR